MIIRTRQDANETHATINFIEKTIKELCPDTAKQDIQNNKGLIELKRNVRKFDKQVSDRRLISEDPYGYYTVLITLPEDVEDPDQYFENNERLTYRPSMYDCTGQHFTISYKVCKRQGRYMIYHKVGVDI